MIEASTQFMVGTLSTESGKCNSFNWAGLLETTDTEKRRAMNVNGACREQ